MRKITIIFSLIILFAPSVALAAYYYVSPTGTATWPDCTSINTPCGGKTAVENAEAGDTVYFRGGTYDPAADPVALWAGESNSLKYLTLPWNPANSGAPGNPITFKAYPGEIPVILDNSYSGAFGAANRDWIVWDGFTGTIVDDPDQKITLVLFLDSNNCVIRNSNLIGITKGDPKNSALIRPDGSRYLLIENNRIHGMNGDPAIAGNSAGILNFNSRDMTIKNNDIYDNWLGIWDKDTEQNNSYYNNHIWGGSDSLTSCKVGIQINNQGDDFGPTSNILAYQNVIRDCTTGVFFYNSAVHNDVSVYNNVIYTTSSSAEVGIMVSDQSRDAQIYNNIIYGYPLQLRYRTGAALPIYSDNNSFYNASGLVWNLDWAIYYTTLSSWGTATGGLDVNSITSDPLFVSGGYMLQAGSPARGAGRNGKDIGAFPDGTLINIGATQPGPPTGLQ